METESVIVKALGGTPWAKVWDHLIIFREVDHAKTHVAKETGVARPTMEKIWDRMIEMSFIISSRKIGSGEYYKLNMKNQTVKAMIKMANEIMRASAYREIAEIEAQPIPVRGYR